MDFAIFEQYGPSLLRGFGVTILCWLLGTVFGMALGLVIALIQRYGPRWVGWILQIYIEVIRGTPFLVQLFVLYYGGPLIGLRLDALPAGLLGLTIYGSPYFAEIFRSGFRAVPVGQLEAARAMGMPRLTVLRRIWLPQALHRALPTLGGEVVLQLKATPLVATITVIDIYSVANRVRQDTFIVYEPLILLALVYMAITGVIVLAFRRLEKSLPSRTA